MTSRAGPHTPATHSRRVLLLPSKPMQGAAPGLALIVHDAYIRAHNSFVNFETYLHTSQDNWATYYAGETEDAIRELAVKLLAAFEYLRLPDTAARLRTAIEGLSATAFEYSEQMGGMYSTTLEVIRPYVEIAEAIAGLPDQQDAGSAARDVLKQLLRSTGRYLFLRKVEPTSESSLQKEMYPLLKAAFPRYHSRSSGPACREDLQGGFWCADAERAYRVQVL